MKKLLFYALIAALVYWFFFRKKEKTVIDVTNGHTTKPPERGDGFVFVDMGNDAYKPPLYMGPPNVDTDPRVIISSTVNPMAETAPFNPASFRKS